MIKKSTRFFRKNKINSMNFTKNIQDNKLNLDLTPIIDVVFNLLIFFALSLNFSELTSSLNIKLPKAKSSEVITDQQIVISIEKGNKISINDKAVFLDQIPTYLSNENQNKVVVIKADTTIDHGFVVQIMDIIKQSGFKKLGIATKKVE